MIAFGLAVGACASVAVPQRAPAAPAADLALGRAVYEQYCAGCHGRLGEGVLGPELAGVVLTTYPDPAQQIELVRAGTSRGMPPFADRLSAAQIDAVVAYTRLLPATGP